MQTLGQMDWLVLKARIVQHLDQTRQAGPDRVSGNNCRAYRSNLPSLASELLIAIAAFAPSAAATTAN
jgi:hypothetical protein